MLADGGEPALLLSRSSFDVCHGGWSGPIGARSLIAKLLPEEPISSAHPASDHGRHRMPNFLCARHKLNPVLGEDRAHERSVVATCGHGYSIQTCAFWSPRGLLSMCLGEVILGCLACPLPRPCSLKSIDLRGHRRPGFWRTCIMDVGCSTAILDLEQIVLV
jgi:hypothetical protein